MNREILFRAKQPHNGEWMEGYFCKDYAGVAYITTLDGVSTGVVDESTLGQFTGLTDKNGVKIFEGDIESSGGVVKLGIYEMYSDRSGFPTWIAERKNGASFVLVCDNEFKIRETIIGNIHDK